MALKAISIPKCGPVMDDQLAWMNRNDYKILIFK